MVKSKEMQERGVEVIDVHFLLHRVPPDIVGFSENLPAANPAASHEDAEAEGVVVPAVFEERPPLFSPRGVLPNSDPQTTRVSSSSPRCLRSLMSAATGWSAMVAL